MKTRRPSSPPAAVVVMGFTLAEMLTSMAVFSLLVVCIVTSHLMGMKMFNIAATKLSASHGARAALNRVRDEIRQGKRLDVGVRTGTNFDSLATGGLQKGNALKIFQASRKQPRRCDCQLHHQHHGFFGGRLFRQCAHQ